MNRFRILLLALLWILPGTLGFAQDVSVDDPGVCLMCHSEFEDKLKEKSVHTILQDGGHCATCHNPHAANHAALLNDDVKELCTGCHTDVKHDADKTMGHTPATKGNCLACHDPHASDYKYQLLQPIPDLCQGCHSSVAEFRARSKMHAPVAASECMTCHEPHGSDQQALLADGVPGLCFGCHDNDQAFTQTHKGADLSHADCLTCHDPHSSNLPNLIMANQHPPFRNNQCSACHAAGATFDLVSDIRSVCTRCHTDIRQMADKPYTHNLMDDRSCMNCHNAHASPVGKLLSGRQQTVCLHCHFKEGDYADKPRAKLLTHEGMDCTNCHEPHGSTNDLYLIGGPANVCNSCHATAHQGAHPMGPETIDPRDGKPLTCISCHKLHGADFEPYMPLDPNSDLCIQCHTR